MKSKLVTVMIILTVYTGLSLLLYPTASNYLKSIAYRNAISDYRRVVEELEPESYDDILAQAEAYNADLASREFILLPFSDEDEQYYQNQVVLPGTDVMGYIVIPKIHVSLPIYHGTDDAVLQNGVGHLRGSSLPVGGRGTHSVLSGHRGLVSSKLFTDLDKMVIGDTFQIRVLKEVLTYEVDEIKTVLPSDASVLLIDPNEDYCTLLTCTPYGVNSHRLLVRGHRIPTPVNDAGEAIVEDVPLEEGAVSDVKPELVILIGAVIELILVSTIVISIRYLIDRRIKSRQGS